MDTFQVHRQAPCIQGEAKGKGERQIELTMLKYNCIRGHVVQVGVL